MDKYFGARNRSIFPKNLKYGQLKPLSHTGNHVPVTNKFNHERAQANKKKCNRNRNKSKNY